MASHSPAARPATREAAPQTRPPAPDRLKAASLVQELTPQMAAFASALIRETNRTNRSLLRGLELAEQRLMTLGWEVSGGILLIQSASQPEKAWETDGEVCQCPATRGHCWHRGAWLILCTCQAASSNPLAHRRLPIAAGRPQLPAHSHLDDVPGNFLGDFAPLPPAEPATSGFRVARDVEMERIEAAAAERRRQRRMATPLEMDELQRRVDELL